MTFEQWLTFAERFGIPLIALIGVLYVMGKYIVPYVVSLIQQSISFRDRIIDIEREQRIKEREAFLLALNNQNTAANTIVEILKKMDAKLDSKLDAALSRRHD